MILVALLLILFVKEATNIDEEQPKCSTFQNLTKTPKFVDKSLLIRRILDSPRHIYIAAPPGFGKSTNLQMLKEFFSLEVDSGTMASRKNDIAQLARRFNKQEHISNVRSWYGGYKVTRKGHCLYNTRSTIRYFETGEFEPYRDESNKLKTLKKVLSYTQAGHYVEDSFEDNTTLVIREKINYGHFEDLRLTIFDPYRPLDEKDLVLQILFDHGFFTMGSRNKLKVPNIEAMHDIKSLIFDRTYYIAKLKITKEIIRAFVRSIEGLSGEDGPFHDFSRAVIELFRGQVPRSAREMAHALVFFAADARKFSQVRGEETPDGNRQDVLVKRSEEMGIVIGIMVGSVNDEALKPVFTKSLQVFHDCRVKVAVLLGLKPGEKGGDLEVLFTEILPSENQSVVERSEHLHHEAHVNHSAMTRKEKIVIGHVVTSSTLSSTATVD
ncbi:unnamed protein product [Bemisia tabaci]|uniref:AAA-ATPase-like domain-containing protein n=2 Tax=Bemisia tabaci TaxID=7038 RepID=A0A9P0A9K5_BEMTA|nr:unnamed protein product [Bemisia tabaci]